MFAPAELFEDCSNLTEPQNGNEGTRCNRWHNSELHSRGPAWERDRDAVDDLWLCLKNEPSTAWDVSVALSHEFNQQNSAEGPSAHSS